MTTTLVTGGTGYVGSFIVPRLKERGGTVRLLIHDPRHVPPMLHAGGYELVEGNVTRPETLSAAFEGVDAVVHLVAVIKERGEITFERVNYGGTVNVVEAAKAAGVRRFLHMSANGARADPRYPYLDTKYRAQEHVRASGLDYTIFQPSVIFGAGDEFVNKLADLVRKPLIFFPAPILPVAGDGSAPFQPVWGGDVAEAFARALADPATIGQVYQLGGPERLTYGEMLDVVMATLGTRRRKLHVPLPLMKPAVLAMNAVLPDPPVTGEQFKMLAIDNSCPQSATERLIGRPPRRFAEGITYIREPGGGRRK